MSKIHRYHVLSDAQDSQSEKRDLVFVWYDTLPKNSPRFIEMMTDIDGSTHKTTIPRGKMQPKV
ncbi:hypothetical protein BCR34DRAFT_645816 [Clohesyomyces aquaticus]|uniref:2,6-dihydroxypyridine 3-monooxygenase substrate binding domain-containing protein n=1 Tax=Clohesyomyces aquaticus TaxID=1231657 RepID=A0A1Y1Y8N5_9PLEO|nr:hypothetical protein BCR34DRAFT_645816 [Clohesyomyces aquaticus]